MRTVAPTDGEIIAGFLESGETRDLEPLVTRHIGRTRAMVYHMVLNDADADELVQEVFLRAISSISGFRRGAVFSTWLYRIALNVTYSFLRKGKRTTGDSAPSPADCPGCSEEAAAELVRTEMGTEIEKALASLPPALRAAVTLTAIHGLSAGEAAEVEGCLTATMYWRIHVARKLLKDKLNRYLTA